MADLNQILIMALRADTPENEASAAFGRARVIFAKNPQQNFSVAVTNASKLSNSMEPVYPKWTQFITNTLHEIAEKTGSSLHLKILNIRGNGMTSPVKIEYTFTGGDISGIDSVITDMIKMINDKNG